ncbi:MAG: hypothetical protein ACREQO_14405 [Candidatus Binatia bacterium]
MRYHVKLILGVAGILFCQVVASPSEAADSCQRIVGDWGWFIGGKVSFAPNAQAKWTPGTAGMPPASASWTCDPRSGTYTVTWQNGFVDTLRLSADGAQLSGTISTGVKISGSRTSSAARTSPPPATTNVMALTGRTKIYPCIYNAFIPQDSFSELRASYASLELRA